MADKKPEPATRKLGKYELVEEVGRGAFGVVHRGRDPFIQRDVAIKIAIGQAAETTDDVFFAEARAAGKLSHPYIVSLYDAAKEEGQRYIVMEYLRGETLRDFCEPGARMGVPRVADLMLKCALALDYMHKNGVLHKDIKPANIMVTPDGTPKLMDFGIAAGTLHEASERTTRVQGSPMFMSPEQLRGQPLSPASDLYSLGAVMYLLLTGEPMWTAATPPELFKLIRTMPAPSLKGRRMVPDVLAAIVDKLLAKSPKDRYQSGRDLGEDLMGVVESFRSGTSKRKALTISDDALKDLRFFKAFKSGELRELLDASQTVVKKPGEIIIKEGDTDNTLYILLAGLAEVRKGKQLIALLEKGDVFGEIGFLYAVKRTASVIATTDVLVLKVNSALLEQMSEQCQLHYYKVFCENLILRLTLTTDKAAQLLPKSDLALDFILP